MGLGVVQLTDCLPSTHNPMFDPLVCYKPHTCHTTFCRGTVLDHPQLHNEFKTFMRLYIRKKQSLKFLKIDFKTTFYLF